MQTLRLYFTSDLHGYIFPTDYTSQAEKPLGLFQCAADFEKDGNTLVIDGGDILQGSALNQYLWQKEKSFVSLAYMMNVCAYDYVTLGNHDFNFGQEALQSYVKNLNATCLCENVRDVKGQSLFPAVIHTLENGLRIGLIGIITDFVNVWEKKEHLKGLVISDALQAAENVLEQLKGKVDLTIGIYHGGFERDLGTGELLSKTGENIACLICEKLSFDLLLTGHQHMVVPGRKYHDTYIIQPPVQGQGYAYVEVTKTKDEILFSSQIRVPRQDFVQVVQEENVPQNPQTKEVSKELQLHKFIKFAPLKKDMNLWLDEAVGKLPKPLMVEDRVQMALSGNPLADFFNKLQLHYSGAQISATSLANEARGLPANVKRRDLFLAYPYANTFVVLEITGAKLKEAVERSAEYLEQKDDGELVVSERFLKPKVEHYNYDFFAGIQCDIDYSRPHGKRVLSLCYGGEEVSPEGTFTICTNDYRASGAGGYPMYVSCPILSEIKMEMTDLLLDYFSAKPAFQ